METEVPSECGAISQTEKLAEDEGMKGPPTTPPPPRRDDDDDDAKELALPRTPPPVFDASQIELPPSTPTTPLPNNNSSVPTTPTTPADPTKQSPTKSSVLGIEKAKQRLKAMGIQKKIQMDARNRLTPKTPKGTTKSRKDSGSGKKTISPHEKAQNTINEIEILKREEAERPILPPPVLPYDESMIHHIQADAVDDGARSLTLQMPLTSSLEAIKAYDDVNEKREERRRRRTKPEAYRSGGGGSSRRRLNFRQHRRDDRFGGGDTHRNERKSKKRSSRSSHDRKSRRQSKERSSRPQSFANFPAAGHQSSIFRETEVFRFTRTRPVISFAFNSAAIAARAARKSKAKERKKQKTREKKSSTERNKATAAGDETNPEIAAAAAAKSAKKKRRSSKDAVADKKKKKQKSADAERPAVTTLSFNVDDLIFEEEIVDFPLAKDGFEVVEEDNALTVTQSETVIPAIETESLPPTTTVEEKPPAAEMVAEAAAIPPAPLVDDKSPDTDDYMPNWEEEEEDSSKDDTPTFPLSKIFEADQIAATTTSTTVESAAIDESTPESIKDGLGTPIFVNPSPPDELIANLSFESEPISIPIARKNSELHQEQDDDDSKDESSTTPPPRREPLFGMQVLYEEFLQSMHEEPDLKDSPAAVHKDTPTTTPPATTLTEEVESGFISNDSARLSSPSATSSSSTSSSSSSSSTSTPDQTEAKTKKKKKRRKIASPGSSNENLSITPDDLKKLRSLQKRRTMLKIIRKQSDGMDDEDKQCLLGLEKLIRAERHMLLRNDAIKKLQETDQILGSDSDDDSPEPSTTPPLAEPSPILGIFDANREAIKLTISNKNQSPVKKMQVTPSKIAQDETSCDDQDFTEKLKKIAKEDAKSSSESDDNNSDVEVHRKKQRSRSPLSSSPVRRPNHSPSRSARSSSHRKRSSPRSKLRSRKNSTRRSRRSRSPLPVRTKRFSSRSPPYRPPSPPPQTSPSRDSISPKDSRKSSPTTPLPVLGMYPGWNIARYPQYYINDSYYYPAARLPNGDHSNSPRPRYAANSYQNYAPYNVYANEYMAGYQTPPVAFSPHVTGPHTPPPAVQAPPTADSPYSTIPVLETSGPPDGAANFYGYASDEFEKSPVPPPPRSTSSRSNETPQIKEIIQHDDKSGKSLTFAVQKGNVLEIVPAVTVIKQEVIEEAEILAKIKEEPDDESSIAESGQEQALLPPAAAAAIGNEDGDTKPAIKQPSSKKRMSWKDEVSRRHVISAVMRLNKETDDSLRGILRSRANSSVVLPKEKKKVLFADGIPPGQTSSGSSDEEATLKLIRRRLKKKQRRLGNRNKENENMMEKQQILDSFIATKVDPELWDAPPPPPPIGSPPANLPQPVLIRPTSPEELLYFHFDPVYSMMYVSPMETPVPPRLLETNGKVAAKSTAAAVTGDCDTPIENGGGTPPRPTDATDNSSSPSNDGNQQDGSTPPQPPPPRPETPELSKSPEQPPESHTPPPRLPSPNPTVSSPPQQIQNIVSLRMNTASPQQQHFPQPPPPTAIPCPVLSPFDIQQQQRPPPSHPVMVGYPMFNRAQRMMAPNMMRSPFNMPPPSPQQQQQQQQHCFNPHVPPPFANSGAPGAGPPMGYHPPPPDCPQPFGPNMMMFNSPQQQQSAPPLPPPQQQQQQPLPPQNFMFNIPAHIMMARTNRFSPVPPPQQFLHPADSRVESPRLGSPIFRHPLMQQQILQQQPNDDNGGGL